MQIGMTTTQLPLHNGLYFVPTSKILIPPSQSVKPRRRLVGRQVCRLGGGRGGACKAPHHKHPCASTTALFQKKKWVLTVTRLQNPKRVVCHQNRHNGELDHYCVRCPRKGDHSMASTVALWWLDTWTIEKGEGMGWCWGCSSRGGWQRCGMPGICFLTALTSGSVSSKYHIKSNQTPTGKGIFGAQQGGKQGVGQRPMGNSTSGARAQSSRVVPRGSSQTRERETEGAPSAILKSEVFVLDIRESNAGFVSG